jgi:hypothetical protein
MIAAAVEADKYTHLHYAGCRNTGMYACTISCFLLTDDIGLRRAVVTCVPEAGDFV